MPLPKKMSVRQWLVYLCILAWLVACAPEVIKTNVQLADQLEREGRLFSHQLIHDKSSLHYMASCDIRPLSGRQPRCQQHPQVKRILIFVHGTPGDWTAFAPQLADTRWGRDTLLIAVDRPGWGQSALQSERVEPSLVRQARDFAPLLKQLQGQFPHSKIYVVGHSLGASLVPLIAIESPVPVAGVIAIAGDLFAEAFSPRWYNYLADLPIIRAVIPRDLCFANEEVMGLADSLQQMKIIWHKLHSPLLVLQGDADKLVDPKNAELVKQSQPPGGVTVITYPGFGHLMHLEAPEKIDTAIRDWIDTQEQLAAGNDNSPVSPSN